MNKPVLIIGIGNLLLMDEGIGIHVVEALSKTGLPPYVEVLDGGTGGLGLLGWMEGRLKIIVIDAVDAGEKAGTVFRFQLGSGDIPSAGENLSMHQQDLAGVLRAARILGKPIPEMVMIAIQTGEIGWGMEPTPAVRDSISRIISAVKKEVDMYHWLSADSITGVEIV